MTWYDREDATTKRRAALKKEEDAYFTQLGHELRGAVEIGGESRPAAKAKELVAEIISQFDIPAKIRIHAGSTDRRDGHGAHNIIDGVINVGVSITPRVGAPTLLRIPVKVTAGRMLRPSVAFVDGRRQLIAQSVFDDILEATSVDYHAIRQRKNAGEVTPEREDRERAAIARIASTLIPDDLGDDEVGAEVEHVTLGHDVRVAAEGEAPLRLHAGLQGSVIRRVGGEVHVCFEDGTYAAVEERDLVRRASEDDPSTLSQHPWHGITSGNDETDNYFLA